MRIDNFVCNPPYNNPNTIDKKLSRICNNIIDCVKDKNPQNFICVCPMNGTMKYRTAEFVDDPFGIRWNNVFIFDCLGDINEYFSRKPCPLWNENSNDVFWLKWGKNKNVLCLDKMTNGNSKRNVNKCIVNQTTLDFIEWVNENKQWELYHIPTTAITKVFINRLWEIYNEERPKSTV